MANQIQTLYTDAAQVPKLPNGLTPLLSGLLDSRALSKHRAMIGFEQEVLAKMFPEILCDDLLLQPIQVAILQYGNKSCFTHGHAYWNATSSRTFHG